MQWVNRVNTVSPKQAERELFIMSLYMYGNLNELQPQV